MTTNQHNPTIDTTGVDRPIPVIVDLPRADPGLGFEKYVSAIAAAIVGGQPAQYTVGLYGPWGTGKSSILLALEERLKKYGRAATTVTFDAWRHERTQNLLAPLLWTLMHALSQKEAQSPFWKKIFSGLELQAFGFGVKIPDTSENRTQKAIGAVQEYMESLQSLATIGEKLAPGSRIVVLIDDLDRCSPDRVIEVIEAIRLFMDVPGFVFVLAIDYDVLIDAVRTRYPHADPHRFVEKIVQVPFRIPNVNPNVGDYLKQVIGNWDSLRGEWFIGLTDNEIRSVIGLALRDNPRQIKRMLNSYMVARHIDWDGLANSAPKARILLASLAMQLRWPQEFEELAADIRRYQRGAGANVPNPILGAVETYKDWLTPPETEIDHDDNSRDFSEFLRKHLDRQASLRIVDEAMRVASDVSGIETANLQTPEQRRIEFMNKVLGRFSNLADGFEFIRLTDGGELIRKGSLLAKVYELRSVPQTFKVKIADSALGPAYSGLARMKTEGKWTIYSFELGPGRSLEDALDDAAQLLGSYSGS